MKIIDRYILGEMVGPALAALAAFVVLITGHVLYTVVDVVAGKGVPLASIVKFAALKAPDAAILAMPVAALLGCSLALNRLASDHELIPMLTSGVSGVRLMAPALALGFVATCASFALKEYAVPRADQEAQRLMSSILVQQKTLAFKPGQFVEAGNQWIFVARDVDNDRDTLEGLLGFMKRADQPPWVVYAPEARFSGRRLVANNARFNGITWPGSLDSLSGDLDVDLTEVSAASFSGERMENRSLGRLLELRRQVAAGGPLSTREYDLEIHGRLSLIFACLVFSLLAAPVALRFGRGQSLAGILATLVVAFVYYVVMMGMRVLGGNGVLPVPVAAWAENVVVLGLSLWGMRRF